MKKAIPTNNESIFEFSELFFSRTNPHGVIESGNEVFARVSEYTVDELINKPHSIVRHPDMPRSYFHLMWQNISAGKTFGGYVKNLTKNGAYYWVYMAVFPIGEHLISIRLKPSSPLLEKIQEIYRIVLVLEDKGLEFGLSHFDKLIQELGYSNYEQFMVHAFIQEMKYRDQNLDELGNAYKVSSEQIDQLSSKQRRIYESSQLCQYEAKKVFQNLIQFLEQGKILQDQSRAMLSNFKGLHFISINMAVEAEKAGDEGATLAQVAIGFKSVADDLEIKIRRFYENLSQIQASLESSQFQICSARLQIEMVEYFLNELIKQARSTDKSGFDEYERNLRLLIELAQEYTKNIGASVKNISRTAGILRKRVDDLTTSISALQAIRVSGSIESAQVNSLWAQNFVTHIMAMEKFLNTIASPLRVIMETVTFFVKESQGSIKHIQKIDIEMTNMRAS